MRDFILGIVAAVMFGAMIFVYYKRCLDEEVDHMRETLNVLRNRIDEGSALYRRQVDDYNDYVRSHADALRRYGIDAEIITRKSFTVPDVRNGREVDVATGEPIEATSGQYATQRPPSYID